MFPSLFDIEHLLFLVLKDQYGCFRRGVCHLGGAEQ